MMRRHHWPVGGGPVTGAEAEERGPVQEQDPLRTLRLLRVRRHRHHHHEQEQQPVDQHQQRGGAGDPGQEVREHAPEPGGAHPAQALPALLAAPGRARHQRAAGRAHLVGRLGRPEELLGARSLLAQQALSLVPAPAQARAVHAQGVEELGQRLDGAVQEAQPASPPAKLVRAFPRWPVPGGRPRWRRPRPGARAPRPGRPRASWNRKGRSGARPGAGRWGLSA